MYFNALHNKPQGGGYTPKTTYSKVVCQQFFKNRNTFYELLCKYRHYLFSRQTKLSNIFSTRAQLRKSRNKISRILHRLLHSHPSPHNIPKSRTTACSKNQRGQITTTRHSPQHSSKQTFLHPISDPYTYLSATCSVRRNSSQVHSKSPQNPR